MGQIITIVSGLPRSGTSLMMQILSSGGMKTVTDNIRAADVDNPKGYYEFEEVKQIKEDSTWLKNTRGKVFKMVSMLLYDLPPNEKYKIIFMERDMGEILTSQRKMLKRLKKESDTTDVDMGKFFNAHLSKISGWLERQRNIDVLYVSYNDLIKNPLEKVELVNKFLSLKMDVRRMAEVIDESLYRNRFEI
ncbi:sulfotransferase domain-containing protein [Thermodesulfobacteriota bacterium]